MHADLPGRAPGRPCTSDESGAVETDPGSPSEATGRPADRIRIGIATDSNTQNGLFHIHKAENKRRAILQDRPRISGPGTRTGSERSGSHRTAGVAVGNRAVPLAHGGPPVAGTRSTGQRPCPSLTGRARYGSGSPAASRAVPLAHGAGSASPAPPVRVDVYSRRTSATTAQVVSSAHASAAKMLIAPPW